MTIELKKERNVYNGSYYRVEIKSQRRFSKQDYSTLIDVIEKISDVVDPIIDKEIEKKEKSGKNT